MKKTFSRLLLAFTLVGQTAAFVACSDHDYQSLPPYFSDMTFTSLHGHSTLCAGDTILVTAVQSQLGRLLYKASYQWSTLDETDSVSHKYCAYVVYDNDPSDPVDTIVFHRPGTYTVKLTARYMMSGNFQNINDTQTFGTAGKATISTLSQLQYGATVQNRVFIRPASN